jgi:hypothetical protein
LQPRNLCKNCRRNWTHGVSLRNVPIGGAGRKKNKRSLSQSTKSSSISKDHLVPAASSSMTTEHLVPAASSTVTEQDVLMPRRGL